MIKVIINADDLGKSSKVNKCINNALSQGLISSSTILANSCLWDEIHEVVDNNQASFGVHLNLTEGLSFTKSAILQKSGIIDKDGMFTQNILSLCKLSQEVVNAVYYEWDAQINKVINIEKIRVSHFDGHHHVHALFPLRNILVELARKYSIKYVRNRYTDLSKNKSILRHLLSKCLMYQAYITGYPSNRAGLLLKERETKAWRRFINNSLCTPDFFSAYESTIDYLNNGMIIKDGTILELMCHPGHPRFESEYQMIINKELQKYLQNLLIINYYQI